MLLGRPGPTICRPAPGTCPFARAPASRRRIPRQRAARSRTAHRSRSTTECAITADAAVVNAGPGIHLFILFETGPAARVRSDPSPCVQTRTAGTNTYFFIFATNSWILLPCAANPPPSVLNWMISAPAFDLKLCGAAEHHVPSAADLNGPVNVDDLDRALQNVSPVFNPAQIVLQSLSLQDVREVSTRGKDVVGALHAAHIAHPRS